MNTAVFTVVNAVLLRPLSYPAADRVVWVTTFDDRAPMEKGNARARVPGMLTL